MSYFIDLNHVKLPFLHAKVTVKYKPHMVQPKICKCYSLGDADKLWGVDKNQVQCAIRVSTWRPRVHSSREVGKPGSFGDIEGEREEAGVEEETRKDLHV